MGSRWAWVGMVGLCALTSGCRERGEDNTAAALRVEETGPAKVRAPVVNALAESTVELRGAQVREPAGGTPAASARAPATGTAAGNGHAAAASAATGATAGTAQAPARANRVMIGSEAVQARDDEEWHLGAARAAQDAATGGSGAAGTSLDQVVIASSSVNGRVTRVGRNAITVRDREGGLYELRLDEHSRGLRQGRKVSLRGLQEGTPVRAQFVLMGGHTFARDVRIRR